MKWAEVRVKCDPRAEELVGSALQDICGGISVSDAGATIRGWLPVNDRTEECLLDIMGRLDRMSAEEPPAKAPQVSVFYVEDSEWSMAWREFFRPFVAAGTFRIRPPWENADTPAEGSGLIDLVIEPGMAFGTGQHPTTDMMLQILSENRPDGLDVLDVGAGSAILSVAAVKLGASRVVAVEIDPVAEENARRNIRLNKVDDRVHYVVRDGPLPRSGPFQMALMNIVATVIMRLAPQVYGRLASGGLVACSGIIDERLEEVRSCLRQVGFVDIQVMSSAEWRALIGRKP